MHGLLLQSGFLYKKAKLVGPPGQWSHTRSDVNVVTATSLHKNMGDIYIGVTNLRSCHAILVLAA